MWMKSILHQKKITPTNIVAKYESSGTRLIVKSSQVKNSYIFVSWPIGESVFDIATYLAIKMTNLV